ncbi:MAG: hypothetical protein JSU83_23650 [Deltaproteobacteria bacterium]|nr:MAG: hypothetical protein JSU83_23650 [Deltaproteobacteria bacterium]
MFVKWVRQPLNNGMNCQGYRLNVFLGDGLRENLGTEQCHLGTIEERFLSTKARDTRAFHQGLFWVAVDKNLDILGLETAERQKIEAEISAKIPRPSSQWALWGVVCCPAFDK